MLKFSKRSPQVLQKCASQPNNLPASGSKSSNTRESCSRQRSSIHPCFADANPLYLESSPSASAVLPMRALWRDLCSQVLLTHLQHGSARPPHQVMIRHPRQHVIPISAQGQNDPSQGQVAKTWSQSCQLQLQESSPASRQVGDDREQSPRKLRCRKGFAFHIQYILLR